MRVFVHGRIAHKMPDLNSVVLLFELQKIKIELEEIEALRNAIATTLTSRQKTLEYKQRFTLKKISPQSH